NKPLLKSGGKTRREVLADYVTGHDQFAKAYINRIWGHLFGRGLNKEPSVDDFGTNNEVVHPELLDGLAKDFVKYNYDPKLLIEWICTSDAYSLSHVALKEYADTKFDPYFARMPLKALSPEVLFESLMTATKAEDSADADTRKKLREDWMQKLVRNFGDDEGNELSFNGTVIQALMMMNGRELNGEINRANSSIRATVLKHAKGGVVNAKAVIDDLFLATVNRHPTGAEIEKITTLMNKGAVIAAEKPAGGAADPMKPMPGVPGTKGGLKKNGQPKGAVPPMVNGPRIVAAVGPNELTFYQDLFWALLNTNEFMLNH
ncbi:MAG: DUF1553 domain-containing protein, partial [Gemmataceae bacterium]